MLLFPVYLMIKVSFSLPAEVLTQHPTFLIHHVTLEHWKNVLSSGNLWAPLRKSLVVATLTTVGSLLLAAPASYVVSRLPQPYRYASVLALFFTRMFPEVGIALPIAVTFIKWNLTDTVTGLVLAHMIKELPFTAWILVGTFETIPTDLEKAAQVDGASRVGALMRVVMPLALPGLAVASIFAWLDSWNEFTMALYLTLSDRTLPLLTYYYINRGNWFSAAAYSAILTVPVMVVTFFLQRYLRTGYLSGAVKG
ncbi:MAG: carbohydrate ABC transporter permease [Symbiobacteriia bacterium]